MNWQQTFLLQGSWKWAGILYCLGSLIHHCGPENWTQSSLGLFWYVSKQGSDQTFSFFFMHWSCGILFFHLLDSRSGLFSQYCSQRPFLIMFSALQHWFAAFWGLYPVEERFTRSFTYVMQHFFAAHVQCFFPVPVYQYHPKLEWCVNGMYMGWHQSSFCSELDPTFWNKKALSFFLGVH